MIEVPIVRMCMASSPACSIQAMTWGKYSFSMQFHIEVERGTIKN